MPPDGGNGARGNCDGLQDRASWIPLAVDFNQDGATVTETVTSTFAALPTLAWTFHRWVAHAGTILSAGQGTLGWRSFSGLSFIGGVCHRLRLGPAPVLPSRDADRGVPCGHRRP